MFDNLMLWFGKLSFPMISLDDEWSINNEHKFAHLQMIFFSNAITRASVFTRHKTWGAVQYRIAVRNSSETQLLSNLVRMDILYRTATLAPCESSDIALQQPGEGGDHWRHAMWKIVPQQSYVHDWNLTLEVLWDFLQILSDISKSSCKRKSEENAFNCVVSTVSANGLDFICARAYQCVSASKK